ncbi:glycosyltransferase [Desulfovibrio sulfodismutans]|uniref:Glycosyltransferase n=1 Tax=Desulfolutivibrio sulfodismutans TaxID=63561 RepID=A0A7K3NRA8_9BACT|nr:glycosyltransferase [Desulfolutivibrio sulfodismutans]NDY58657.1 glycosyltransferase [Desulfolutivibrio sulfodismutans]QLA12838.1 glycosyltransferase [Desulfolutivibrio sulfodismutans DSM 3696]
MTAPTTEAGLTGPTSLPPRTSQAGPPLCSVVIPALNAARHLPGCLAALHAQTMPAAAFEIIVVDDGSTDDTASVAQACGATCLCQPHTGPGAARNRGARMAQGSILVFTDADCRPEPDWLEAMVQALSARAGSSTAGAQGVYATDQQSLVARFAQSEFEDRYELMRRHPSIDLAATYSAAYRRDVFLEAGGFDERFPRADNEDTELSYRLSAKGHSLALAPGAVVRHQHPATLGSYLRRKFSRGYWRTQVYRLYPDKAARDRYTTVPVKLGTLAAMAWILGSLAGLAALPLAGGGLLALAQVCPAAMLALSWPMARRNWHSRRALGAVTPGMILLRGVALGCGVLWGMARPAPGFQAGKDGGKDEKIKR